MTLPTGSGWEHQVRRLAQRMAYPATPDVWPAVRAEVARRESRRAALLPRRAAVLAAVLLAVCLALSAIPEARAAVYRVFQIGVIRILVEPATPTPGFTPGPTAVPSATATPLLQAPFDLQGAASLSSIEAAMGEAVRLPTYPKDIGDPDLAFLQSVDGPIAVLVWLDPEDAGRARLALTILGRGAFGGKANMRLIEETRVDGRPALWLVGPHALLLRSGEMDYRTLVQGNVLIWELGETTYRLETDQPLQEAIRIAESMQ
jgi:hypothetical protein